MSDFKYQFFSWLSRKWFLIILKLVYTLLKLAESSQPFRKLTTIQTNVSFCLVPDTNYVCGVLCMCDKTRCGLVQHHQCDITTGYLTFFYWSNAHIPLSFVNAETAYVSRKTWSSRIWETAVEWQTEGARAVIPSCIKYVWETRLFFWNIYQWDTPRNNW